MRKIALLIVLAFLLSVGIFATARHFGFVGGTSVRNAAPTATQAAAPTDVHADELAVKDNIVGYMGED